LLTRLVNLDHQLFFLINRDLANFILDIPMELFSNAEFWFSIWMIVFIWSLIKKRIEIIKVCVLSSIAVGITDALAFQVLKPYFERLRPCYEFETFVRTLDEHCGGSFGFPSNHAANAMAFSIVLFLFLGRNKQKLKHTVVFLMPLVVGISRSYLGVHYPGDVLAGFLLGGVIGFMCYKIFGRIFDIIYLKISEITIRRIL